LLIPVISQCHISSVLTESFLATPELLKKKHEKHIKEEIRNKKRELISPIGVSDIASLLWPT
jgi:hypothetical protein